MDNTISDNSLLLTHWERYGIGKEIPTTRCFHNSKTALKATAVALTCLGRIPYWSTSASASSNPAWGRVLALFNTGCWMGVCTIWMIDMVDGIMRPLSPEEKKMFEQEVKSKKITCCFTVLKIVTSVSAGILAQVPYAAIAYRNNGKSIFMGLIPFLDAGLTIYSLILTSENITKACCSKKAPGDKKYIKARERFIQCFEAYRVTLLDLYEKADPFLKPPEEPIPLIEFILAHCNEMERSPIPPSKIVTGLGWGLGGVQLFVYACATKDGMELITQNEAGQYAGVASVTAVNTWLEGSAPADSMQNILNRIKGPQINDVAEACFRKFRKALRGLGVVASTFCYGFPMKVSEQEMTGNLSAGVWPVKLTTSLGNALIVNGALEKTFDRLTIALAKSKWFGSDKKRDLIDADRRLSLYIKVIQNAPLNEFENLVNQLSEDTQKLLLGEEFEPTERKMSVNESQGPRRESRVDTSDYEPVSSPPSWDDDSLLRSAVKQNKVIL